MMISSKSLQRALKNRKILITILFLAALIGFLPLIKEKMKADAEMENPVLDLPELAILQENSLAFVASPLSPDPKVTSKITVVLTAYSSTPEETDNTPYITAAGTPVRNGIVANNLLPFGTKIRMPELYGDKVFVVEDRMSRKKGNYHFDIWFSNQKAAENFGVKITTIEILES